MDKDRLWILLQASGINPRCGDYYAAPTDPRVAGLSTSCEVSELNALDWLHENGVPDARAEHLREPAFWQWYEEKLEAIRACGDRAVPGSKDFNREYYSCDPYERITQVERRSLEDAGFRKPPRKGD